MATPSITYRSSGPDSVAVSTSVRTWYFFFNDSPAVQIRFRVEGDELITQYRPINSTEWGEPDPEATRKFRHFANAQEGAAYYLRQTRKTDWLHFIPLK